MPAVRVDEASVAAHSAHLRKDLGLLDLTLTQVLFIVGLPWVGVAAKQGPAHVLLWLQVTQYLRYVLGPGSGPRQAPAWSPR